MKKILFINGHLNTGGVERSLVDVLQHIDYSKYDVSLLLFQGSGEYAKEIPAEVNLNIYDTTDAYGPLLNAIVKNLFKGRWFLLSYRIITQFLGLRNLSWIIPSLQEHYDVAIAYRSGICTDILVENIKCKNKISWWHHGEMNTTNIEQQILYSEYKKIQHIVAVSESSGKLIKQHFPSITEKLSIIPNMLCTETIIQKALQNSIYTFLSGPEKLHLVSVGRLSPEKNMRFCILVAKYLKEMSIPFEWILIGDGEEHAAIKEEIRESNLDNIIRMTGALSNPYPIMKSADILFHPSLVESQGLTILEAMALGTPVICVKSAGPSEFITNEENGIIINNGVREAVEAITRLYKDAQLRKSIAVKAHHTLNAYKPEKIIHQIEKLF